MDKIKVSKEIGEALEQAFHMYRNKDNKAECILNHTVNGTWAQERALLHKLPIFQLAEILIKGYEVEETPEDKIIFEFNNCLRQRSEFQVFDIGYCTWDAKAKQTVKVLDLLEIKIKGIND